MKNPLGIVLAAGVLTLGSGLAIAQSTESTASEARRMVVMFKPDAVATQYVSSERIDTLFPDGRVQSNPQVWDAVALRTASMVRDLEAVHGFKSTIAFGAFTHGLAGEFTARQIDALKADPRVESVFPDALGVLAGGPPPWNNSPSVSYASTWTTGWNLSAISADTASSSYRTDGGYPVKAFVLDSGVQPHFELNYNPATSHWSFDTHGNPDPNGNACSDHATHVAGIIGAYRTPANVGVEGVAPGAVIWSMRIVNYCQPEAGYPGLAYLSSVLTAINAIDGQTGIAKEPGVAQQRLRAVANMSVLWDGRQGLPGRIDLAGRAALRETMRTAVDNGIFFSVAGGNSNQNAKDLYPAAVGCTLIDPEDGQLYEAVGGVMAVGAIQWTGSPMDRGIHEPGKKASYGPCVKIWAPGQSVHSTVGQVTTLYPAAPSTVPPAYPLIPDTAYWNPWGGVSPGWLGQSYFNETSGSSMAAPHIAGAALLYAKKRQIQGLPLPYPWEIENFLLSRSAATQNYGPPGESAPVNTINVSGF